MKKELQRTTERALLAARYARADQHDSMAELARLVDTAGATVIATMIQERDGIEAATYIGSGKAHEIAERVKAEQIDLVVFDHELSASQQRNLEKIIGTKILDRTGVILDIFARHATSREGKLQVELAQMHYWLPRLVGQVSHWSRLGGGIGTLGPGETLLEMERRRFRDRIAQLKAELRQVEGQRALQRKRRQQVPVPLVSLVGYTNAGKSSLMNRLTDAGVLVRDALFATLDPTVRRVRLPSGREFLLADTVGFVRKLPHQLVEAFKATLKEIDTASLLLHVVDTAAPEVVAQVATVERVLAELGLQGKPSLRVFNKMDCAQLPPELYDEDALAVSAKTGQGLVALLARIETELSSSLQQVTLQVPFTAGSVLDELYRAGRVLQHEDLPDGVRLVVELGEKWRGKFAHYIE